jgi:hypothetical protein
MSVIQLECARNESGDLVCNHIRQYYPDVSGEPPVFFVFDETQLPAGSLIDQVAPQQMGDDPCHYNVTGVGDGQLKKLRKRNWSEYSICDNGTYRSVTQADVDAWKADYGTP